MAKKSKRKKLTEKLDKLCLGIIRLRDKNTCQKCGKKIYGSNSHPCHVIPKGNGASMRRFDLLNIFLGCTHCHLQWWHLNILEAAQWFENRWPARSAYLEIYKGGKPAKITTEQMENLVVKLKEKCELPKEGK